MVKTVKKDTSKKAKSPKTTKATRTVRATRARKESGAPVVVADSKKFKRPFDAYMAFWRRGFTDWRGTSSRSAYWWCVLVNVLIVLGCLMLFTLLERYMHGLFWYFMGGILAILFLVFSFATIIPSMSLTVRRLHDAGFSSWWVILYVLAWFGDVIWISRTSTAVSMIAGIILCVLMLMPTKVENNPYHKYNRD